MRDLILGVGVGLVLPYIWQWAVRRWYARHDTTLPLHSERRGMWTKEGHL